MRIPSELLNREATITPCLGVAPNGKSFGTPIEYVDCYVEFNVELSTSNAQNNPKGEQRIYGTLLYFNDRVAIPRTLFRDGKVTLDDDDKTYEIVVSNRYRFAGTYHWEVQLR